MTVNSVSDLKTAANRLATRPEVLAVEYLDKKNVFGSKASIKEM